MVRREEEKSKKQEKVNGMGQRHLWYRLDGLHRLFNEVAVCRLLSRADKH